MKAKQGGTSGAAITVKCAKVFWALAAAIVCASFQTRAAPDPTAVSNQRAATEPTAASHQRIEVYRFNDKLEHGRPTMWRVEEGPPLAPVYVVAGSGDILALVKSTKGGALLLKRWTTEGRLISSWALGIEEDVIASSLSVEAKLTLVTRSELIQVAVPLSEPLARVALPERVKASKNVAVSSFGAWFEIGDQLVRVGLDGRSAAVKLPLYKVPAQYAGCRPDQVQQFPCKYVDSDRSLLATANGGCVVIEGVVHDYRVPDSYRIDQAGTYVLSSLDSLGQLRAQSARGEVKSEWEWFWSDSQGPMNSPKFGLVRTRHVGTEGMVQLAERANGDLLLLADPPVVWRLDRSLRVVWRKSAPEALSPDNVVSPPWARDVAVTLGGSGFFVVDDKGRRLQKIYYFDETAMDRPPGVATQIAVGQSRQGEWLIVNY